MHPFEDFLFRSYRDDRGLVPLSEILKDFKGGNGEFRIPTKPGTSRINLGLHGLDRLLSGLSEANLIALAARPSLGKSTLALNIARHVAGNGTSVGIISLEMSREQLILRMLSSQAEIDSRGLALGVYRREEEQQLTDAIGILSGLPLFVDDAPLQTIEEVCSKADSLYQEQSLGLLIVDYLQLLKGGSNQENRVQDMSDASRSLKILSRNLNIPVLAILQLSGATQYRAIHPQQLSDLRDSGSIEQDADVVAFIHREDVVFTEEEWEQNFPDRKYPRNIAEIIVAKHRNGPLSTLRLFFRDQVSRFENFAAQGAA